MDEAEEMFSTGADPVRSLLETLREDVRAPAALRAEVMRRVREVPDPLWRRALDWCLRPRTLRVSPAGGGLALAALVLVLALWTRSAPLGEGPVAANDAPAQVATTRFVLVAPEVSSVRVTGDFNSWDAEGIPLEDLRGTGIWTADIPLDPGVYQYTFIIDGTEWRPDPRAVAQVDDGYGQTNSVMIVSQGGRT